MTKKKLNDIFPLLGIAILGYVHEFVISDKDGNETSEYPQNPNGSDLNCAGLTDRTGHIFGLMPHPEAFLSLYNHPNWSQMKRQNPEITDDGEGLKIFTNIVKYIQDSHS